MSLTAHIKTLEKRKLELEKEIQQESSRPMPNFMLVHELKKKKLRIKEKIYSLVYQRSDEVESA